MQPQHVPEVSSVLAHTQYIHSPLTILHTTDPILETQPPNTTTTVMPVGEIPRTLHWVFIAGLPHGDILYVRTLTVYIAE